MYCWPNPYCSMKAKSSQMTLSHQNRPFAELCTMHVKFHVNFEFYIFSGYKSWGVVWQLLEHILLDDRANLNDRAMLWAILRTHYKEWTTVIVRSSLIWKKILSCLRCSNSLFVSMITCEYTVSFFEFGYHLKVDTLHKYFNHRISKAYVWNFTRVALGIV